MSTVKVWREGNRIRSADGTGYADVVTDARIWEHIVEARSGPRPLEFLEFAAAVLRLRATEREAKS